MTREELGNRISSNIASVAIGCTNIEITSAIMKDVDQYAPRKTSLKSTQAMRDRIRELMSREQDDYDRAIECVLDDLEGILGCPTEPLRCLRCGTVDAFGPAFPRPAREAIPDPVEIK